MSISSSVFLEIFGNWSILLVKDSAFCIILESSMLTFFLLGLIIPFLAFYALAFIKQLNRVDRGAIAAHYGSTSLVTFTAALIFLENNKVAVEGFATALLTLLEIPGLIVGIFLGTRAVSQGVKWGKTLVEVFLGKTVLLLIGGLVIGFITTQAGYERDRKSTRLNSSHT